MYLGARIDRDSAPRGFISEQILIGTLFILKPYSCKGILTKYDEIRHASTSSRQKYITSYYSNYRVILSQKNVVIQIIQIISKKSKESITFCS